MKTLNQPDGTQPARDLAATTLYDNLLQVDRLLVGQNLLSKTDETMLVGVLTRAVRKVAKKHPELKLAAKWDLRNLTT